MVLTHVSTLPIILWGCFSFELSPGHINFVAHSNILDAIDILAIVVPPYSPPTIVEGIVNGESIEPYVQLRIAYVAFE